MTSPLAEGSDKTRNKGNGNEEMEMGNRNEEMEMKKWGNGEMEEIKVSLENDFELAMEIWKEMWTG